MSSIPYSKTKGKGMLKVQGKNKPKKNHSIEIEQLRSYADQELHALKNVQNKLGKNLAALEQRVAELKVPDFKASTE